MADKPFACQEDESCDKRYGRKCSLKRHILHKHSNNPEENNEKPYVCRKDEACDKKCATKSSLAHHVSMNDQTSQPAGSIQRAKRSASPAPRPVFNREWWMKFGDPNAGRTMDFHPLRHVPPPSRPSPLHTDAPMQPSSKRAKPTEALTHPSSKRARHDIGDRERDCEEEHPNSSDVADNEYRKTGDVKDETRNDSIIKDFLAFYNENDVDIYSLDLIALFLIKHSKIAKKNDANYFAATSSLYGMVCIMDGLQTQTLYDIVTSYYWYVRKAGLFDWDCLIIAFTMAHNLLMKYPHLKQEIVEMLHEVFYLAGNDLTVSGGWNNFLKYSEKFIA